MIKIALLIFLLSPLLIQAQDSQEDLKKLYHQFDFWLGNWEVNKEGKMVLDDVEHGDSEKGLNRITWVKEAGGLVRQTWTVSQDGGQNWTVAFDGQYKPKK
jgi:hypothetical protein